MSDISPKEPSNLQRRHVLTGLLVAGSALVGGALVPEGMGDEVDRLLQNHFLRMTPAELAEVLLRIERQAHRDYGVTLQCLAPAAQPGVVFGFALNLSRCIGARRCVTACVRENNCGRDHHLGNIRVISLPKGSWNLAEGDPYYHPQEVPEPGRWYLPIQCQQCQHPACVGNCPVGATWKEPDGVVVIDYDWCIGCRVCAVVCPYGARHFNWKKPQMETREMVTTTHYLGNRPRDQGVMEKCTLCLHRTREGRLPACLEACETGARVFGNLADAQSEIRHILATHAIFRLKEDQGTSPTFFYYLESL